MWASHLLESSTEASSQFSAPQSEQEETPDVAPVAPAGATAHHDRISMSSTGIMSVWTANRKACLKVSCVALPVPVLDWMELHVEELESVVHRHRASLAFARG